MTEPNWPRLLEVAGIVERRPRTDSLRDHVQARAARELRLEEQRQRRREWESSEKS